MLSSSHILAMDTKNLLDVCDSIKARFPNVKYEIPNGSFNAADPQNSRLPQHLSNQANCEQTPSQQEVYGNVSADRFEVSEQLYSNQAPPTEIGIYDNHAAIQEQLKIIEEPTSPVDPQFNSQKILSN